MIESNSHIALLHDERVPEHILEGFCSSVSDKSLSIERISRPTAGPQMGIEWLALPAIALFFLKPYLDGFMKEAGRDHYSTLRRSMGALWRKLFGQDREFKATVVTARGIKRSDYSMVFAVYTTMEDKRLLKLLFQNDCSASEFEMGIEAFVKLARSHYEDNLDDEQKMLLDHKHETGRILLLEFDKESNSLRVVNPISLPKREV
ncbi:MAG: hypothetical protein OXU26_01145 [Acidobacteriota bacterium]|nr:hypothetical protein [Acidobacteriota bacterium]